MYKNFYNLKQNPFELSPDPYFFCPTPVHNETLTILTYGVVRQKGFVVATGEVGTGKTLLVRCLLDVLSKNNVCFAYIYNPLLSVADFLTQVLSDLGLSAPVSSKREALSRLNNFLLSRSQQGLTTALVVDEAQLLSYELLEEIRLLTNLETTKHKLLQVVLVGQPGLDKKIESHAMRHLKQRIAFRCFLKPLELTELRDYVHRRLELAGATTHIFSEEAIAAVAKFSKGIPRLVNTICEGSLLTGLSKNQKQITADIVAEAAADLRLDQVAAQPTDLHDSERQKKVWKDAIRTVLNEMRSFPNESLLDRKPQGSEIR